VLHPTDLLPGFCILSQLHLAHAALTDGLAQGPRARSGAN
jgi:hypothetical protein